METMLSTVALERNLASWKLPTSGEGPCESSSLGWSSCMAGSRRQIGVERESRGGGGVWTGIHRGRARLPGANQSARGSIVVARGSPRMVPGPGLSKVDKVAGWRREHILLGGNASREGTAVAATEIQAAAASAALVLCFGEMLVDFVPTVNAVSLAEAPAFQKAPGGAPANVAVGVARLGGRSAFLGKVGDDEFGHMLEAVLRGQGVDTRAVRFDRGARTALAFVTLRADGEREFMFYRNPSADMLLESSELDLDLIRQAGIVHYGSISLIAEPCRSAHVALMGAARHAGATLSYDPNLRLPLWPSAQTAREEIRSIWDQAHIIKVSDEEIAFLTEGLDPSSDEAARALFHPGLRALLVTEGGRGCRYYTQHFSGRVPGFAVEAVDTTGAGDAYVAGFLCQLSRDLALTEEEGKLREALAFANACGAIATTERGAIPALPDQLAVAALLNRAPV